MTVDVALIGTHVAPAKGYGGVAENTGRLVHAWAAGGRSFRLCACDASAERCLTAADVGLPPQVPVALYHAHWWRRWGFGVGAPWAVLRACLGARAVYVNGIATWPTSLAGLLCRILRRPFVVAPRGGLMADHVAHIRRSKPHKWAFYRLVTLPTLRRAAAVHATSAIEADGVRALLPAARIVTVPNALDLSEWPLLPLRTPDGGRVFCYVGRLSPEKGILPFLRLWLDVRRPGDRFLIAGSGTGPYARAVEELAEGSGGAVRLLGYLDRHGLLDTLARSDVAVLPSGIGNSSLRENFGNATAEALATGRPVLVTRGIAWDGVEAEGAGVLFDADEDAIRGAIRRVQEMPADGLAAMSAAARRFAEAHLELHRTSARLWALVTGDGPVVQD